MQVEAATAIRAHPAPLAHERGFAEQRWFDRQDIEASHVAARIPTFQHQHLQLVISKLVGVVHLVIIERQKTNVQRKS